jgi:hypothetical protein
MPGDKIVVVAAQKIPAPEKLNGEYRYTAAVVTKAEELFGDNQIVALKRAMEIFLIEGQEWFESLIEAKQFASRLGQELRQRGELQYENRKIIEIGKKAVYRLKQKGNRRGNSEYHSRVSVPYSLRH